MEGKFSFYNPTKIYFGEGSLVNLENELDNYGPNIMLAYGFSSIKKIGLYDKIIEILKQKNKNIIEFSGIMPNPTYEKLIEGCHLVKENNVDLILAVGGGSVIDCAKGISASAYCNDPWDKYWIKEEKVDNKIVPVASILTMVGTGSEMNGGSVITNEKVKIKAGHVFEASIYPKFSILDPTYTYSVSEYQMLSGIFDIISHLLEQYFSGFDNNISDYLIEALLKAVIDNTYKAIKDKEDYEARSNLMWASTVALNTLVACGKTQDWQVHSLEHQLSAYTNCAHGMGLAAISPSYYRYIYKDGIHKFARFAHNVFGLNDNDIDKLALMGISKLEEFIKETGMVYRLRDLGATEDMLEKIAYSTKPGGGYKIVGHAEMLEILKACF